MLTRRLIDTVLALAVVLAVGAPCALAREGQSPAPALTKGGKALAKGDLERAARLFESAAEIDPTSAAAEDGLGQVALQLHRYEVALGHFERAAELYRQQLIRSAESEAERRMALAGAQREYMDIVNEVVGACQVERHQREISRNAPDPAGDIRPDLRGVPAAVCFRRGVCLLHLGRTEDARAAFEDAVLIDRELAPAHLDLAVALLALDDPEGAEAALAEAERLGTTPPPGLRQEITARLDAATLEP